MADFMWKAVNDMNKNPQESEWEARADELFIEWNVHLLEVYWSFTRK